MTTQSSAIAPPAPDAVEDTPALVEERRDRLVKYFEDCRIPVEERVWICPHRQIVPWEDDADHPTECNADFPACSSARGEFLGMVESIADIEGCDQRWICLKCKARHVSRMTVNEPWMRHCQKYRTVLESEQCGGSFCPGTRTGGAWYWKCKGICSLKQWDATGDRKNGTLSRSNFNPASRRDCPFLDHPESGCGVTLDGSPVTLDNVATVFLNIHPAYLAKEQWWFFCHCTPEPDWKIKSAGPCKRCGVDRTYAESKAREDGKLWQFYFR
ncbi:hypothetical protein HBI74_116930 [Parastagonospora nodorum]|nr:hypothetical protein HBI74_116930 [Parastagonospora nodorum]